MKHLTTLEIEQVPTGYRWQTGPITEDPYVRLEIEQVPTGYRWVVLLDRAIIVASGTAATEMQAAVAGGLALLKCVSPISPEP